MNYWQGDNTVSYTHLNAFQFGAPPHAGMAPGIDRMIMLLRNEENIREAVSYTHLAA